MTLFFTGVCLLMTGVAGGVLLGIARGNNDLRATDVAHVRSETEFQYQQALADIEAGNYELAHERLWAVINLNRAYADAEEQYKRVRWHLENPPTPVPTATPPPTSEPDEAPPTPILDVDAVFAEAESAYQAQDWEAAINRLDTLMGAAPDHRTDETRAMLFDALMRLGKLRIEDQLENRLEEGINLIDRAMIYGPVSQELLYQRNLAAEYLSAIGYMGVDWDVAIDALRMFPVPEYRDVQLKLFEAYRGYANSYYNLGDYCPAVQQYQNALGVIYDADVEGRRADAQSRCASATETPVPTVEPTVIPGAVRVTVYSKANIREGPSSQQYGVLEELGSGAVLSATGRNAETTWLFVTTPTGTRGWVFIEVVNVELVGDAIAALPVTSELGGAPPAPPAP